MLTASDLPHRVTRNGIGGAHDSLEPFQTAPLRIIWAELSGLHLHRKYLGLGGTQGDQAHMFQVPAITALIHL